MNILQQRLHNQLLTQHPFQKPEEVVGWLGAVQSQDYEGGKWAVAQRIDGMTDSVMEKAFTDGKIIRTHILRPTWHFVTPADLRWILALTAPRVKTAMGSVFRSLEIDHAIFSR